VHSDICSQPDASPFAHVSPPTAQIVAFLREAGAPVDEADPTFNPNRAPLIVPKDGLKGLKFSRNEFWKVTDPKENVVCKCERVTEAEVIEACRRSLPIDSTQVC
jgi:glycerol-3-phosphate dehydrogenase